MNPDNEHEIHVAEKLGLTHRTPQIERRAFLRGMLSLGAIAVTPAGLLTLPEPKIYQVPRPAEDKQQTITCGDGMIVQILDYEPRDFGDLGQYREFAYKPWHISYDTEPYDKHLDAVAQNLGLSYAEVYERRYTPEIQRLRAIEKRIAFAENFGGTSAATINRYMQSQVRVPVVR